MDSRLFLYQLVWVFSLINGLVIEDENVTLAIPEVKLKWEDAAAYCVQNGGGHLVVTRNDYMQMLLGTVMKMKLFSFLWVGAKERDRGWTWADDTSHGNFLSWAAGHPVTKDTEPRCAFLRGSDRYVWVDHPCAMQHAFICEFEIRHAACKEREAFLFTGENGGRCLVLHQRSPRSWYKSRETCVSKAGRLAVFNNETLYTHFRLHLRDELQVSGDYWIGLRDSALEWTDGSPVIRTYWEGGQPSRSGECVQLEKFGQGVYLWANQNCDRKQRFACQLTRKESVESPRPSRPGVRPSSCVKDDQGSLHLTTSKFVGSIVFELMAFLLGVFIMVIPLVVVCFKYRRAVSGVGSRPVARRKLDRISVSVLHRPESHDTTFTDILPPPPVAEGNLYTNQLPVSPSAHGHNQSAASKLSPPPTIPIYPAMTAAGSTNHAHPHAQGGNPVTSGARTATVSSGIKPSHLNYDVDTSGVLYRV